MNFTDLIEQINRDYKTKLVLEKVSFFENERKLVIDMNDFIISEKMKEISDIIKESILNLDCSIDIRVLDFNSIFINFKSKLDFDLEYELKDIGDGEQVNFILRDINFKNLLIKNSGFKKILCFLDEMGISYNFEEDKIKDATSEINKILKEKESDLQTKIIEASKANGDVKEVKKFRYGFFKDAPKEITEIENVVEDFNKIKVLGKIYELNINKVKKGSFIKFDLDDGKYAIRCKTYIREEDIDKIGPYIKNGMVVEVSGVYKYDDWEREVILNVSSIEESSMPLRKDLSSEKRVEFNIHTKYSATQGLIGPDELFNTLKEWGHDSVAVTDLYNVQAYPEIYGLAKKNDIKLNLGLQAKLLEDDLSILTNHYRKDLKGRNLVVFDIETTGLSRYNDRITEIGAVKIVDGEIVSEYQRLINPEMPIPEFIVELTGITDSMVANQEKIDLVLPDFLEYCKDSILVAHNAEFDMGFITENARRLGLKFEPIYLDTLYLARGLNPNLKNHKLDTLTKHYGVSLLNHHRASDDARSTGEILLKMFDELKELGVALDDDINRLKSNFPISKHNYQHGLIYVKNQEGLKNLYRLVSISSLDYLNFYPGIPYKVLEDNRKGLLVSTGNYDSKLFDLIALGYPKEIYKNELEKYDIVTLTPKDFSEFLIRENYIKNEDHLKEINLKLFELARETGKIAIGVGDVYYIEKDDYIYRNILNNYPRKRFQENTGCFYLKTTEEMLDNFDYFDESDRYDLVVRNTRILNDSIEDISPIAKGTFPPVIENASEILTSQSFEKARSIYGENLPEIVEKRLERELNSIISNGYATLYIIAQKLVRKSNDDGYLVGSRGSVGSSFAATMADITEVNPLPPHYVCPNCKNSDFDIDANLYACGVDLPDKKCPKCGHEYKKDGFDIPFEVFLGFEGDKEPDIDLNFASVYQAKIHKYTETLFGDRKVFRAGTLGTIAEKTAFGMARKYKEYYPDDDKIKLDAANINKIKRKLVGVKRTTGQHAGGLIIVPEEKDIEDFTPIQYPADQSSSGIITTHFDYHAIDKNLLKLDLLGHNAPTIVRMLTDQSGVNAIEIDLSDQDTISIFNTTDKLGIKHDYTNKNSGSLGIPEFGTGFVREMLKDTKPTTFAELVRISGLSHGTDVWLNNAQSLINSGICELKDAICTRDDIMNYLISMGLESKLSFDIMEKVRKGKGLSETDIEEMEKKLVPTWYIESCQKIKYMFPKAHAVAYVMMAYRIAYYKVHYPAYFYSTYFTNKISDFQYGPISNGLDYLTGYIKNYMESDNFERDDKFYCLELGEEMLARDIQMKKADLYKSHAEEFIVLDENTILAPLMAVDSVSQNIALNIVEARKDGEFISIEDFKNRTRVNKTALQSLQEAGLLSGMQETNQIDFFSL